MSATLSWKPVNPNDCTYWGSGSSLVKALESAFGCLPRTLGHDDIPKLEGIAACGYDDINDLIRAILDKSEVIIDVHY